MKINEILNNGFSLNKITESSHDRKKGQFKCVTVFKDGKTEEKIYDSSEDLLKCVKKTVENENVHLFKSHIVMPDGEKSPFGLYLESKKSKDSAAKKADDEEDEEMSVSKKFHLTKRLDQIRAKMKHEGAKNDSDSEIKRVFTQTVLPEYNIKVAKQLRDDGYDIINDK